MDVEETVPETQNETASVSPNQEAQGQEDSEHALAPVQEGQLVAQPVLSHSVDKASILFEETSEGGETDNNCQEEKTTEVCDRREVIEIPDSPEEESAQTSAQIKEPPCAQEMPLFDEEDRETESESESNLIQGGKMSNLVSVRGNPKVMRCTRCNTFVSLNSNHSAAECSARLKKFLNNRGKRKCGCKKGKKQDCKIISKLKAIAKKYNTCAMRKKYKFPAQLKNLFDSVC